MGTDTPVLVEWANVEIGSVYCQPLSKASLISRGPILAITSHRDGS